MTCKICGRKLTPPVEPMIDSSDCGGDCWACIKKIEENDDNRGSDGRPE